MKVGDKVYLVNSDSRIEPETLTIKSIGRKYITLDGIHRDYSHVDIATRQTINYIGGKYTMYNSKEDYLKYVENEKIKYNIRRELEEMIKNADMPTLCRLLKILKAAQ